jgi:sulfopyruvate decarboxylase TPP-binding subunit
VTGVPDSGFEVLIAKLDLDDFGGFYVPGCREDNCVALAAGAYLAGGTPLVFMESSGAGNIVDALTSLACVYEMPLVLFIAWAGYQGRDVPHHNAIGEVLEPALRLLGCQTLELPLTDPARFAERLTEAVALARQTRGVVALLGIPDDLLEDSNAS